MKAATAARIDRSVDISHSAQLLIGTKQSECIPAVLNFPASLYVLFLQLQSYFDASSALVEEYSGFLVDIESSDEGSDGGGLVIATRLLGRSWGAILMRVPYPEVPGIFSLSSSGVHDVTIRFQHLSSINVVVAKAIGGEGGRVK